MKPKQGSAKLLILNKVWNETFDERPITFGGVELRHRRAVCSSLASAKDVQSALTFAGLIEESAPYWIGDLLAYTASRAEWREKASQIMSVTGFAEQTLHNYKHIAMHVAPPQRVIAQSVGHAAIVAKLQPKDQRTWLTKANEEGWNSRELGLELKAHEKRGVLTGQADLEGMFRVWSVDCPWKYNQAEPSKVSAQTHYPGMTVDALVKMGETIRSHCTRNAVGFFWVTAPMLYYASDDVSPDPYRVIKAWGFEPKTGGVWDKVEHNFGNYLSVRHEHLIIATRGSCTPDRPTPMLDSVFVERKSDVHSEKPACAYKMIERLYDGPYCEMFARERRQGWTTYGNQILEPIAKAM